MYKLRKTHGEIGSVIRVEDGACIPFAEDNTDFQEYLRWLELGNQPEPADEGSTPA